MVAGRQSQWSEVVGLAGFAINRPAVAGVADPCTGAVA